MISLNHELLQGVIGEVTTHNTPHTRIKQMIFLKVKFITT
jgi:hypothetical protein